MINIDTVYQTVQALANKEQRGYITPQEFNLFACQAQLEIIEQYFYDVNQFSRLHGNDTEYSDMIDLLNEKIAEIATTATLSVSTNGIATLPANLYKIGTVIYGGTEADMVTPNELLRINSSKLTRPKIVPSDNGNSIKSPVFVKTGNNIEILPHPNNNYLQSLNIGLTYVPRPYCPYWGYVVVDEKAMYNPPATINFVLHASEEAELVNRILGMAGVTIQKAELLQTATQFEQAKQLDQKN